MTLPESARHRLTAPLRVALEDLPSLQPWHTLPIHQRIWGGYSESLVNAARAWGESLMDEQASEGTFEEIRSWVNGVLKGRNLLIDTLHGLQSFEPFNHDVADQLLRSLNENLIEVVDAIEASRPLNPKMDRLHEFCSSWPIAGGIERNAILSTTFKMPVEPVDALGNFTPPRVFLEYKYDLSRLLWAINPHLNSISVPMTLEPLACVYILGSIQSSEDQVLALLTMHTLLERMVASNAPEVVEQILSYSGKREGAMRQARKRISSMLYSLSSQDDHETQALELADIYRVIVEGSVRRYGWAMRCLRAEAWSKPPSLNRVHEALSIESGMMASLADKAILVSLRNNESHVSLEWDGINKVYLTEDDDAVEFDRVVAAVAICISFDLGCEAAISCFRALGERPSVGPPSLKDIGRLPAWRRAEAFFGTNGIRVRKADFNSLPAKIYVEELYQENINPCFQALMSARLLLPNIQNFEIVVRESHEAVLKISGDSLDKAIPVWNQALETFDMMPFSAFLPANFAARVVWEKPSVAARSVAWIAADDVLDAVAGLFQSRDGRALQVFINRIELVQFAISRSLDVVPEEHTFRLLALQSSVNHLQLYLSTKHATFHSWHYIDELPCVDRIRTFWEAWGPVMRLPGIYERPMDKIGSDRQPRLRENMQNVRWHSI